jgi:uncharacterized membrane protein (UPF0127 family)
VLPATLAPRFANARRVVCKAESSSFEAVVAERFWLRLRGLAGLDPAELAPLLLPRCRSLHTFGMRVPIDVLWFDLGPDGHGALRAIEPAIEPRRTVRSPRGIDRHRTAALELAAGDATALGLRTGAGVMFSEDG